MTIDYSCLILTNFNWFIANRNTRISSILYYSNSLKVDKPFYEKKRGKKGTNYSVATEEFTSDKNAMDLSIYCSSKVFRIHCKSQKSFLFIQKIRKKIPSDETFVPSHPIQSSDFYSVVCT